jgi:hypothetical protein
MIEVNNPKSVEKTSSVKPEMFPDLPEMLPVDEVVVSAPTGLPEILPARPEMLPASAAEDIARVKSEAQRIDWKLFMLILLVVERLIVGVRQIRGLPLSDVNTVPAFRYQLVRSSLFQGLCHGCSRGGCYC